MGAEIPPDLGMNTDEMAMKNLPTINTVKCMAGGHLSGCVYIPEEEL